MPRTTAPIKPPTRLELFLFGRLGDHYTKNHARMFASLGITDNGVNAICMSLNPIISPHIGRALIGHLRDIGLVSSRRGISEGNSHKQIMIYSLTKSGRDLMAKAKEVKS